VKSKRILVAQCAQTTTFVIEEHRATQRGALFAETFVNIADYFMLPCSSFPCEMNLG